MEGHSIETLTLRIRQIQEDALNVLLKREYLHLDKEAIPWIVMNIDYFVSQTRDNKSVKGVVLHPCIFDGHDDEIWDKLGQAIGNLQALDKVQIVNHKDHDDDDDDDDQDDDNRVPVVSVLNWERLAGILRHIRQYVAVGLKNSDLLTVEEVQWLGRALHGHPTIIRFGCDNTLPHNSLYSVLATLPALEWLKLSLKGRQAQLEDESTMVHHESLTELLRVPTLRTVCFASFSFTPALCQATANAFMGDTAVTKLEFDDCKFSAGECAATLEKSFSRNTSLSYIAVASTTFDDALYSALAAALPSNSTLQELLFRFLPSVDDSDAHVDWSPFVLALEKNTGLKTLSVDWFGSIDDSLCIAMQNGLGMNEALESLKLNRIHLTDDNLALWYRALSIILTNKALKSLAVQVKCGSTESCLSAFRLGVVAMLQDNTSLESLTVKNGNGSQMKADEYFALVTAVQLNTTLKSLEFHRWDKLTIRMTDDECQKMASLLKKNYVLESLPNMRPSRDVDAILRLNAAGRRYLIEDGSSISKGVEVLSRVNDDINCAFLHLLENPRLCDRSAVEIITAGQSNSNPTVSSGGGGGGKREQASVHQSRESRRRLA
jgi:hypothetical protein